MISFQQLTLHSKSVSIERKTRQLRLHKACQSQLSLIQARMSELLCSPLQCAQRWSSLTTPQHCWTESNHKYFKERSTKKHYNKKKTVQSLYPWSSSVVVGEISHSSDSRPRQLTKCHFRSICFSLSISLTLRRRPYRHEGLECMQLVGPPPTIFHSD